MKTVGLLNDIIKDSYYAVMRYKSSHNKLEFLRRFLKHKYNISIGIDALRKRDEEYRKGKK